MNDTDATLSASNSQEENEQSSDATPGSAQNELPSLDAYDNTGNNGPGNDSAVILTASDRAEWLQITPGENSAGRRSQQNIFIEVFGPRSYVKRNVFSGNPEMHGVFLLITLFSNTLHNAQLQKPIAYYKIRILSYYQGVGNVPVMYAWGVRGKSALPLHDIWTEKCGVPLCKNVISKNRFCKILRFICFDIKSSHSQRLQTDKFALFLEIWTTALHCINLEPLSKSTNSFSLAKPDALLPSIWHRNQINLGKILVSGRQREQIHDKLCFLMLEKMNCALQMIAFLIAL